MSEIKCLVCKGTHFRKGYYDIDVKVEIYSADISSYETDTNNDLEFRLSKQNPNDYSDDYADVFKYVCDDCGYIMSFIKEKKVTSRKEKQEEENRKNSYDWRTFK